MVKNIKFHAIAISIIVCVIIILYLLIGPKQAPPAPANAPLQSSDRYIHIVSATWGRNCDESIAAAIKSRNTASPTKDTGGNIIPQKPLERAKTDNVLSVVKSACDEKITCNVAANTQAMNGVDPFEGCYKKLTVSYRCFELDRLSTKDADQGQTLAIDCTPVQPNAPAPAAAHP